jgi:hypothetical protein
MNPVSFPCRKCGLSIATKPNGFCRLCKEYRKQSQQLNTALPTENSARLTRKYSSIHHKLSSAHPHQIYLLITIVRHLRLHHQGIIKLEIVMMDIIYHLYRHLEQDRSRQHQTQHLEQVSQFRRACLCRLH